MSKKIKYSFLRFFMRSLGRLSDGIDLCYKEGLTSGKMLDYVYKNKPSGKFIIGKMLDKLFLGDPGWAAVRTRRENLEKLMIDAIRNLREENRTVSILDIASGPGAYVLSVIEKVGKGNIFARCRDFEFRWVEEGNLEAQRKKMDNVRFERGDAFNREEILKLTPKPNLVVASGFYDWFNEDDKVNDSIKIVFDALENGGYFVLSNQSAHPKLEFTEQVFTDFNKNPLKMTMRSKELMVSFLKNCGFDVEETLANKNGYYIVIKARKH